jgi:predicted CXXCH cytochrome family protein
MVRTDGPDGKLTDYEIAYTFGVYPLQQYLIPFPGGRYQMLPIAWDSRPKDKGGQRWFHLQPGEKIDHKDPLHWTGRYQNWALQCAECHSTDLKQGLRRGQRYLQDHLQRNQRRLRSLPRPGFQPCRLGRQAKAPYAAGGDKGLPRSRARWNEAWKFPAKRCALPCATGRPTLRHEHLRRLPCPPLDPERGRARPARRSKTAIAWRMLTAPNYHADGQQREEVYVWGSFLQSKMHQNGVTCMDCHEPHSQKLRAEGNALCTRCHNAAEFDARSTTIAPRRRQGRRVRDLPHADAELHGHPCPPGSQPARAAPRPVAVARQPECLHPVPHRQAAGMGGERHGQMVRQGLARAPALRPDAACGRTTQGASALPDLLELAASQTARRSSGPRRRRWPSPMPTRHAAGGARAAAGPRPVGAHRRARHAGAADGSGEPRAGASPLLADPVRGVRIEAANVLADVPDSQIPEGRRGCPCRPPCRNTSGALALEADWPAGSVNLGNLRLRQGRATRRLPPSSGRSDSIRISPRLRQSCRCLAPAGREAEAEKGVAPGLAVMPRNADLHHALGLLLIRKGDKPGALQGVRRGRPAGAGQCPLRLRARHRAACRPASARSAGCAARRRPAPPE